MYVSYYQQNYLMFVRDHALMHFLGDGLHLLYCAYQHGPTQDGRQDGLSSHISSAMSSLVGTLPIGVFFVIQGA